MFIIININTYYFKLITYTEILPFIKIHKNIVGRLNTDKWKHVISVTLIIILYFAVDT